MYQKNTGSLWVKIGNIKGADGAPGQNGQDGAAGQNGHDAATYGRVHTVTFDVSEDETVVLSNGNDWEGDYTINVNYGETIVLPTAAKEGYLFCGWFTGFGVNDGQFTDVTPVTRDIVLYPYFQAEAIYYTVHFDSNGGNTIPNKRYEAWEALGALPIPTKLYCTFLGWYIVDTDISVDSSTLVNGDLYLKARYEGTDSKITYDYCHDGLKYAENLQNGNYIYEFATPLRQDYTFLGWYLDDEYQYPLALPYLVHEDVTLYAKWSYNNPYADYTKIYNKVDLMTIADTNGKYVLMDDIVLDDENFAISNAATPFTGVFDGNGHTISGLSLIAGGKPTDIGMFGHNAGIIKDLKVEGVASYGNVNISQASGYRGDIGTLCGTNEGIIRNCEVNIALSVSTEWGRYQDYLNVGGIVGNNASTGIVRDCIFLGSVKAIRDRGSTSADKMYARAGGIAGYNQGAIECCINAGTVDLKKASSDYNKGDSNYNLTYISGIAVGGTINNCVSMKSLTGQYLRSGDSIGVSATTNNCYYYESVSINAYYATNSGTSANVYQLNSANFYVTTVGFNTDVWDFTDLDFSNGVYPSLK